MNKAQLNLVVIRSSDIDKAACVTLFLLDHLTAPLAVITMYLHLTFGIIQPDIIHL
jgi:hypothetical protein